MHQSWLSSVPWDSILTLNQSLCQAQKVEAKTETKALEQARQLWEAAGRKGVALKEALDLCRECYELNAFIFNNGNTFAAVGRTLLEHHLKPLSPVEAQIIRTTVSHYVVGLIGRRELLDVLRHYQPVWQSATRPAAPAQAPVEVAPLQPQASA